MPGCHTLTLFSETHKHAQWHRHTRLLSGKQSQRHGVTETKPQKRRLALCDNPLTHIYIQGLEYASVPPSPPPAAARSCPLPPPIHPLRHFSYRPDLPPDPPPLSLLVPAIASSSAPPSPVQSPSKSGSSVYYQWIVLAWQRP